MTTRAANLGHDLIVQAEERLMADGVFCERDAEFLDGMRLLNAKLGSIEVHRRAARTLEDACEVTPHVERLLRENERDLVPILALSPNFPRNTENSTDTA